MLAYEKYPVTEAGKLCADQILRSSPVHYGISRTSDVPFIMWACKKLSPKKPNSVGFQCYKSLKFSQLVNLIFEFLTEIQGYRICDIRAPMTSTERETEHTSLFFQFINQHKKIVEEGTNRFSRCPMTEALVQNLLRSSTF